MFGEMRRITETVIDICVRFEVLTEASMKK
jgi:hypothetical protein